MNPSEAPTIELRTHGVSGAPIGELLADSGGEASRWQRVRGIVTAGGTFYRRIDVPGDRRIEAFHWGSSTSGGLAKSLWATLIPFALVNVALWMLPIVRGAADPKPPPWRAAHAAVHLIGLVLTVLIMVQLAHVLADVIGAQALLEPGHASPWWTAVMVTAVLLAVLVGGGVLTRLTAEDRDGVHLTTYLDDHGVEGGPDPAAPRASIGVDDFYDGNPIVDLLRTLHGIAAAAAMALYALALAGRPTLWPIPLAVLVVLATVLTWASIADGRRVARGFGVLKGRWGRILVIGAIVSAATVTVWALGTVYGDAPESSVRAGVGGLLVAAVVAAALALWLLLGISLWRLRRRVIAAGEPVPSAFRPWFGGGSAWLLTGAAVALGSGFGVGLAWTLGLVLTWPAAREFPAMPVLYDVIGVQWGIVAAVLAAAIGGLFVARHRAGRREARVAEAMSRSALPDADAVRRLRRRVWRAGLKRHGHQAVAVGLAVVGGAAVTAAAMEGAGLTDATLGIVLRGLGIAVLIVIVVAVGVGIWAAVAAPDNWGRRLGIVWDLASFWPREGHPVVPRSYAPTAITDVTGYVTRLADADDRLRITLCGHSQGSLIMYGAALRLLQQDRHRPQRPLAPRLALLTYGSPLQWAYSRAFPAWIDVGSHRDVLAGLGGRWSTLIRPTDEIGGPVLSWEWRIAGDDAVTVTAEVFDDSGAVRSTGEQPVVDGEMLRLGRDHLIPDPPAPPAADFVRGHSNYPREPAWSRVIEAFWRAP